jgi:AraC-like DNA-binding protein
MDSDILIDPPLGPPDSSRRELISLLGRHTPADGEHRTPVPSLSLFRWSQPAMLECSVTRPSLIIAAQGSKRMILADHPFDYGREHGLIVSMHLPVMAQVTVATPDAPYLCLVYELDLPRIAELMTEMRLPAPRTVPEGKALSLCAVTAPLFDAALRMVRLLDEPAHIPVLGPLVERELLYRLLIGEQGMRLRHLTLADSQTYKISRAIDYLKRNYAQPLRIETLASEVSMSVSSLHHHFKAVTSMSPLQYQKQLRLHEARNLMMLQISDVTSAAYSVGYESPSQFSRDYSRLFGAPPSRHRALLRGAAAG